MGAVVGIAVVAPAAVDDDKLDDAVLRPCAAADVFALQLRADAAELFGNDAVAREYYPPLFFLDLRAELEERAS